MRALLVALVGTFAAFEPVASEPTKLILTGDQTEVHFVNPVTDESCVFSATECAHSLTVDERLTALEADMIELRAERTAASRCGARPGASPAAGHLSPRWARRLLAVRRRLCRLQWVGC